jgi:adenylate kinase family enzyme
MRDFNAVMEKAGRDFRCIHFLLDAAEAERRILGRAVSEGRADDADTAIIRRRMATFTEKTLLVIRKYEVAQKVTEISADRGVDEVYADLRKRLG